MNTIVVYASMTGTTERMAETIASELTKAGDSVTVRDAFEADAVELTAYDRILVGCYTWDDGELADELLDFYEEMGHIDLTGKKAAAFGPGSTTYEHYARAVDIIEGALQKQGCEIITDGLKVDAWSENEEEIQAKSIAFANQIMNVAPAFDRVGAGI